MTVDVNVVAFWRCTVCAYSASSTNGWWPLAEAVLEHAVLSARDHGGLGESTPQEIIDTSIVFSEVRLLLPKPRHSVGG